jgi:pimeloyl-ACP methyl ester carboxylesterase
LWGAEDRLIPSEYGPAFHDLIPNSRLEILPDCGHLPQVEKATEFANSVTRFLQGVRS